MTASTTPTPKAAPATTWEIDPAHSGVHFSIKHLMISTVRGSFGKLAGTVDLDPADPTRASVRATIDVSSITTGEPQRDAHLRSADFFDVEKFPTIEFESARITRTGPGAYQLAGRLTMHGVTRDVVLAVEADGEETRDPWGKIRRGASATTKLNRGDFGLTWNQALETGGIVVGDEVKVSIDVELVGAA